MNFKRHTVLSFLLTLSRQCFASPIVPATVSASSPGATVSPRKRFDLVDRDFITTGIDGFIGYYVEEVTFAYLPEVIQSKASSLNSRLATENLFYTLPAEVTNGAGLSSVLATTDATVTMSLCIPRTMDLVSSVVDPVVTQAISYDVNTVISAGAAFPVVTAVSSVIQADGPAPVSVVGTVNSEVGPASTAIVDSKIGAVQTLMARQAASQPTSFVHCSYPVLNGRRLAKDSVNNAVVLVEDPWYNSGISGGITSAVAKRDGDQNVHGIAGGQDESESWFGAAILHDILFDGIIV